MKSKEEIERLGKQSAQKKYRLQLTIFIQGYTQCQEDMAHKKYTIKEVERYHDIRATQGIKNANNYINSLNKQG